MGVLAAAVAAVAAQAHEPAGPHGHGPSAPGAGFGSLGAPGTAGDVTREVLVEMLDTMRFRPDAVAVRRGDTVRFVIENKGRLVHEFILGRRADLRRHAEVMKRMPGMEHSAPNMVTVAPGTKRDVVWRFSRAGVVHFACLQPGHYDAGMKGEIRVGAAAPASAAARAR